MLDWTPIPGARLSTTQTAQFVERFHQRYRIATSGKPSYIPTWCTFPAGNDATEDIFSTSYFHSFDALYFFYENGQELYQTVPHAIGDYFRQRNPWETNWDFYVLSPDLSWCIAVTHELMNGSAIIVVGTFPSEMIC